MIWHDATERQRETRAIGVQWRSIMAAGDSSDSDAQTQEEPAWEIQAEQWAVTILHAVAVRQVESSMPVNVQEHDNNNGVSLYTVARDTANR